MADNDTHAMIEGMATRAQAIPLVHRRLNQTQRNSAKMSGNDGSGNGLESDVWVPARVILGATFARGSSAVLGLLFGIFGYLLWRLGELTRRLQQGEERLAALEQTQLRAGIARSQARAVGEAVLDLRDAAAVAPSIAAAPPLPKPLDAMAPEYCPLDRSAATAATARTAGKLVALRATVFVDQTEYTREEPGKDVFVDQGWFTEAMCRSRSHAGVFAGVAALLKYPPTRLVNIPDRVSLIGVALRPSPHSVFAWRHARRGGALR